MGAITVEAGDMVVLNDDRRRRLLLGAAMMYECMLCEIGEAELEFVWAEDPAEKYD